MTSSYVNLKLVLLAVIAFYCLVSTMSVLKHIIEPLLWTVFCVMGLKPLVDLIDKLIMLFCTCIFRPFGGLCGRTSPVYVPPESGHAQVYGHPIDVREGCADGAMENSLDPEVDPELDPPPNPQADALGLHPDSPPLFHRTWCQCASRLIAVSLVMYAGIMLTVIFLTYLFRSVMDTVQNVGVYEKGFERIIKEFDFLITFLDHDTEEKNQLINVLSEMKSQTTTPAASSDGHWWDFIKPGATTTTTTTTLEAVTTSSTEDINHVFNNLAAQFSKSAVEKGIGYVQVWLIDVVMAFRLGVFGCLLTVLYVFFWLYHPLPIGNSYNVIFQRYILLKTFVSVGYGCSVAGVLYFFKVDLVPIFGFLAFTLNFLPEIGPLIAALLPIPLILLDSRIENPFSTVLLVTFSQMCLKFFFGNILEVKLIERDDRMSMHPVVILVCVAFFGLVWGPTGMLLSVPIMAAFKLFVLSDAFPPEYGIPILIILEGDTNARHKYFLGCDP